MTYAAPAPSSAAAGWCLEPYHGKKRVISMLVTLAEAKDFFASEEEKLREGHVILVRASLETMSVVSGGYNRTRW